MEKMTFEHFARFTQLPEHSGIAYELDEGELLVEASPVLSHNRIRDRIARALNDYAEQTGMGEVTTEVDFRLAPDVVLNPDVAFIGAAHLAKVDPDSWPIEGAPLLAVEIISPSNTAGEIARKIRHYLKGGCSQVWIIYPALRTVEVHEKHGMNVIEGVLREQYLFPGFSLDLAYLFDGKKERQH